LTIYGFAAAPGGKPLAYRDVIFHNKSRLRLD
jgi:hypothetical protein